MFGLYADVQSLATVRHEHDLRVAQHRRLVRLAMDARPVQPARRPRLSARAAAWLGPRLMQLADRLQAHGAPEQVATLMR